MKKSASHLPLNYLSPMDLGKILVALQQTRPAWLGRLNRTLVAGTFLMACSMANAETYVFNPGGGLFSTFTDPLNWRGGVAPGVSSAASIEIPASAGVGTLLEIDTPTLTVGGIIVSSAGPGGVVTLQSENLAPTSTVTLNSISVATGATLQDDLTDKVNFNGGAKGLFFNESGSLGSVVINGVVGGTKGIVINGGQVTLQGANTYSGGTTVAAGNLIVGSASDLGVPGALIVKDGAALTLNNPAATKVSSLVMEGGALNGTGGGIEIPSTGTVRVNVASGITARMGVPITEETGAAVGVTVTKDGAGRLVLSAANTYTGNTTVKSGVVEVAADDVFGLVGTPGIVILNGGTLTAEATISRTVHNSVQVDAPIQLGEASAAKLILAGAVTLNGRNAVRVAGDVEVGGTVDGNLILSGPGTLTLTNASNAIDTELNDGKLVVGSPTALGDNTATARGSLILNGGILDINGKETQLRGLTVTGGRVINSTGGAESLKLGQGTDPVKVNADVAAGQTAVVEVPITESNAGSVSVVKKGDGSLILSGASEYTGGTIIEKGALVLAADSRPGAGGPLGARASDVLLAGGVLTTDGAPRTIENKVTASSGASVLGGNGTVIVLEGGLKFNPAATLTVNGKMKVTDPTATGLGLLDLNGGNLTFGSGKTGGSTILEVEGFGASQTSVVSFTKDTKIIVTDSGKDLDFAKVKVVMAPEAIAEVARSHRQSGKSVPKVLATIDQSVGTGAGKAIMPSKLEVDGSTAVVKVTLEPSAAASGPGISFTTERKAYSEVASTPNAAHFGEALDQELDRQMGNGTKVAQLIDKLDALTTGAEVDRALRLASGGATYASMSTVAVRRIQQVGAQLDIHLDNLAASAGAEAAGRVHSFGVSPAGNAPSMIASSKRGDDVAQWTAWASGYASEFRLNGEDSLLPGGIRTRDQGAGMGVGRAFGDLHVGLTARVGEANSSFESSGKLQSDHWTAGGFASVAVGSVVLDASALFGTADNKITRDNGFGTVQGDFQSRDTQFGVGLALNLAPAESEWQVTPVARLKYISYNQDAFTERGAGFIDVDGQKRDTWLTKVGFRFGHRPEAGKPVSFSLDGGAYWVHDHAADGKSINLRIAGTNSSFSAEGRGADSDSLQLNLGGRLTFSDNYSVHLGGQQDFGGNRNQSTGVLTVGVKF
jgi:fibronectin-binding autotransporter adhesin